MAVAEEEGEGEAVAVAGGEGEEEEEVAKVVRLRLRTIAPVVSAIRAKHLRPPIGSWSLLSWFHRLVSPKQALLAAPPVQLSRHLPFNPERIPARCPSLFENLNFGFLFNGSWRPFLWNPTG